MRIIVLGATSAIAEAAAIAMAKRLQKSNIQGQFFLVARNREKLDKTAAKLTEAGGIVAGSGQGQGAA